MKITLEIDTTNPNAANELLALAALLSPNVGAAIAEVIEEKSENPQTSQVKPKKVKKEKEPATVAETNEPDDDEIPVEPVKTLDLKKDVIPAFQKFNANETIKTDYKTASAKCQKILAKYGAKSVHELKEQDYSAVVAELV